MTDDVEETAVTMPEKQKTIHDFYGFPKNFYEFLYTAPGNPKLAEEIIKNIKAIEIRKNTTRGLDHGTRSVLAQMYPQANIPTIQLSIDEDLPREKMFEVGKELGKLREQGILILGSGNIVHNLGAINRNGEAYPRAIEFDQYIASALQKKEYQKIF